jgi:transcriptional regulator with XRE-family HTH domain
LQLSRTSALISRLKAHLEKVGLSQVTLSRELGISPAALSEVMRGRNAPNAEVALHVVEILNENSMTQTLALNRRPAVVDDDDDFGNMSEPPRTLTEAKARLIQSQETISRLQKEIASLRAAALPASNPQSLPPKLLAAPAIRPTPAASRPTPPANSTQMIINPGKPLSEMTEIEKLRAQLNTAAPDRDALYQRIKQLEGDTALRAYKAARK